MLALFSCTNGLSIQLSSARREFCFEVPKEVDTVSVQNGPNAEAKQLDKTMEMHYDVSGPEADEVELKVWRIGRDTRERIH